MPISAGTRLGPYEIVAPLGAGGMGEVYRARDPRLGRDVAIKVLPDLYSADPDRLRRFEQEARAAASLNHSNILAVYDIGTHGRAPYIVSELLEGHTLRAALEAGPIAPKRAIDYAVQAARGLAAAHAKGIVHRDVKPENLFVTADGCVKILDFGLAKLIEPEPALAGGTLATRALATQPGTALGTVGYMAPEQVRGHAADHRADLFALGAVLYEMLAGRRAFKADTIAETMTAILREDPPELPVAERHLPPALARIVARCLEKNPAERFQSAVDLAFAVDALSSASGATAATTVPVRSSRWERLGWIAGLTLVTGIAGMLAVTAFRPAPSLPEMRVEINTAPTTTPESMAISPDGRAWCSSRRSTASPGCGCGTST